MLKHLPLAVAVVLLATLTACQATSDTGTPKTDTDTDSDADGDSDADSDADTDADTDDTGPTDADGDGWTVAEGDCDDGDRDVNPGEEDACEDGVDQDCDGRDPSCAPWGKVDLSTADAKFIGEAELNQAGRSPAAGDLDGDGFDDILVGAPLNSEGGSLAGAVYIVFGPASGTLVLSAADAKVVGEQAEDTAGLAVAAHDMDGDGIDDLLVGAGGEETGGEYAGAAYLVSGPVSGVVDLSAAEAKFVGGWHDEAGVHVAAGDVNEDGVADVLVGAHMEGADYQETGAVYLVLGPTSGTVNLASADARFVGEHNHSLASLPVVEDVDGDGVEDILIGAPGESEAETGEGAVYVLLGPVTGTRDLSTADARYVGEGRPDYAGWSLATGDVDGDGIGDVLAGARNVYTDEPSVGAAYLVLEPALGTMDLALADAKYLGVNRDDQAGMSVAVGDVDGDGFGDLLVGAEAEDEGGDSAGAVYVVYHPTTGTTDLSAADAKLVGERATDHAGASLGVGDVDGDGSADVLVGAPWESTNGKRAGAAYLVLGGPR